MWKELTFSITYSHVLHGYREEHLMRQLLQESVSRIIRETNTADVIKIQEVTFEENKSPSSIFSEKFAIIDKVPFAHFKQSPVNLEVIEVRTNPNFQEKVAHTRYYIASESRRMLEEVWQRCLGTYLPDDLNNIAIQKPKGLPDEIHELFSSGKYYPPTYQTGTSIEAIHCIEYSDIVIAYVMGHTIVPSNYIKTLNEG